MIEVRIETVLDPIAMDLGDGIWRYAERDITTVDDWRDFGGYRANFGKVIIGPARASNGPPRAVLPIRGGW